MTKAYRRNIVNNKHSTGRHVAERVPGVGAEEVPRFVRDKKEASRFVSALNAAGLRPGPVAKVSQRRDG
jgi:hypothetical protein